MDYYTVIKKSLLILIVYVHLTSAALSSHSLHYVYTTVTPGLHFPEFTVVGLVDGEQIVYYDSNIRKMIPKTDWMKKVDADNPDYWKRNTEITQEAQDNFNDSMDSLKKHFNQTEGVHTVQKMYGCELHEDGTHTGYMQFGYDGEDFISLDMNTETWTAANQKAVITKQKWES
ncbi:hypothetical protein MHYP_G00262260, partial [Metynnis hypsauchen]